MDDFALVSMDSVKNEPFQSILGQFDVDTVLAGASRLLYGYI